MIAPAGSGRSAVLVRASDEVRGARLRSDGGLVFTLEYVLTRADGRRVRNLAVVRQAFLRARVSYM